MPTMFLAGESAVIVIVNSHHTIRIWRGILSICRQRSAPQRHAIAFTLLCRELRQSPGLVSVVGVYAPILVTNPS